MNIVLLGYRGTGKSTIARILSKRLHRRLFSIDVLIAKAAGLSIKEIVNQYGWPRFREIEAEQTQTIAKTYCNGIVDCGGGVVLNPENIKALRQQGRIVWLTANLGEIIKRIQFDPNRPPLKKETTFEEEQRLILAEREPLYRDAANLICETSHTPADETVSKIIRFFRDKQWI